MSFALRLSFNQKALLWVQYTLLYISPAKIRKPAWEPSKAEGCSVALIHELLPAVISLLFHSIPSTASSPSSHQTALWQIHLADTHYSPANPTAKCRWSKIRACLCSFNFTLGLSKHCQVQKNGLFDWAVFTLGKGYGMNNGWVSAYDWALICLMRGEDSKNGMWTELESERRYNINTEKKKTGRVYIRVQKSNPKVILCTCYLLSKKTLLVNIYFPCIRYQCIIMYNVLCINVIYAQWGK